ncbi:MAG: GNAT family N-acetyltransferase [Pseudonocardiaceae bacterium]
MEPQMIGRESVASSMSIHPLNESGLDRADEVLRLAFGTFLGLPDPMRFFESADYVRTRWAADPQAAFGATVEGNLVGSNFATNWGSVGFFGPLTVHPDLWDRGVGKRLVETVMGLFDTWGNRHLGLFTFANSPKHIELYRKFGFWPRSLTAIMRKPVVQRVGTSGWSLYSSLAASDQSEYLSACRKLTDAVYGGLNVEREIVASHSHALGDTVLLEDGSALVGFAVCHCGPGTEAGAGVCFVKFGAVQPGHAAANHFERLLDACEELAFRRGLEQLEGGMNLARSDAYHRMVERGFRTQLQGVAMHRPNEPGYSHPDAYVIDDWR